MDIDTIKAFAVQQFKEIEHGEPETFETLKHHEQQLVALQQLWLQADQTEAFGCIAGVLIEMHEKGKKEESTEPSEWFKAVDATLEHGLELHFDYEDTYKGKAEIASLSPELQEILSHYKTAASIWSNGLDPEEVERMTQEDEGDASFSSNLSAVRGSIIGALAGGHMEGRDGASYSKALLLNIADLLGLSLPENIKDGTWREETHG